MGIGAHVLVEPLEARCLLSTVTVNTILDQTDATGSGTVSLRDAVAIANASTTPTTITFDPTVFTDDQTITLDGTQLELSNTAEPTTIQGPAKGAGISGNSLSRVLMIDSGVTANLSMISLAEGSTSSGFGGGLENLGTANLTEVELTNNSAYDGGGIYNYGTLYMLDSTVDTNVASIGNGGIGSTGSATLVNDVIFNNSSPSGTGGYGDDGTATLEDDTITDNQGNDFVGGFFTGDGQATISNTIIAGNTGEAAGVVPDVYGGVNSLGYNLIGATDGSSGWTSNDLTGTAANPLNADLGNLQPLGGFAYSVAPFPDSPALSRGSVALIPSGITTDQRGQPRTIDGTVDIGAVEVGGSSDVNLPTTTTISSPVNTIAAGTANTYTVTVAPTTATAGAGTPSGTVSIYEAGNLVGTYTLTNGQATASIAPISYLGGTTFTAVYAGDSQFATSTSSVFKQYVGAQSYTVLTAPHPVVSSGTHLIGGTIRVSDPLKIADSVATLSGPFTFALYLSKTSVGLDANPATLQSISRREILRKGRSLGITLSARKLPATLTAGTYYIVAEVTDADGNLNFATDPAPINVVAPVVTLTATASAVKPATVTTRRSGTIVISIEDTGNIAATGTLVINVLPSSNGVNASSDVAVATFSHRESIGVGRIARFTLRVKVPAGLTAGVYDSLVNVSLDGVSASVIGSAFTVGAVPV